METMKGGLDIWCRERAEKSGAAGRGSIGLKKKSENSDFELCPFCSQVLCSVETRRSQRLLGGVSGWGEPRLRGQGRKLHAWAPGGRAQFC